MDRGRQNLIHDIVKDLLESEVEDFDNNPSDYFYNYNIKEFKGCFDKAVHLEDSVVQKLSKVVFKATENMNDNKLVNYLTESNKIKKLIRNTITNLLVS